VIRWISESWKETRIETVSNCFTLSGFPISSKVNSADSDADDDILLIQLAKINTIAQADREALMGNPDNVKQFDTVSMRVSFHDSLIQCTASNTFISFQINFVLKR
jgi:hypothetical protein